MELTTISMDEFVRSHHVLMTVQPWHENPHMLYSVGSPDDMDHWRCVLLCGRSQMTVYFSMGSGHHGKEPTCAEVLSCLASDITDDTFENWCADLGFDTDSRKAARTYITVVRQTRKLHALLGRPAFDVLRYNVERL